MEAASDLDLGVHLSRAIHLALDARLDEEPLKTRRGSG
jgi:hypothetical protein